MKPTYFVRCYRCAVLAETQTGADDRPAAPWGWTVRGVSAEFAFGTDPDEVLLCMTCRDVVDARMKRAWSDAISIPQLAALAAP